MAWKPTRKLRTKVARYMKLRGQGKEKYVEADELLPGIIASMPVGAIVELPDGRAFEMADNYATRNTAYKPAGVSRFELKEVKRAPVPAAPPDAST